MNSCFLTQLNPQPQYIDDRLVLYKALKAEHDALLAEKAEKESKPIKITLPDGKVVEGESWRSTPYQVACGIRSDQHKPSHRGHRFFYAHLIPSLCGRIAGIQDIFE